MYVEQMRTALKELYPYERWSYKVSKMSDNQVMAVYYRFLNTGKFDRDSNNRLRPLKTSSVERKEEPKKLTCNNKNIDDGDSGARESKAYQVTVFDILREFNLEEESENEYQKEPLLG